MAMYNAFEKDWDQGKFDVLPELHAMLSGMKVPASCFLYLIVSFSCKSFIPLISCGCLILLVSQPHSIAVTVSEVCKLGYCCTLLF